jgi:hypothetical protein
MQRHREEKKKARREICFYFLKKSQGTTEQVDI